MGVEWDELPAELIESISKKLTIYVDYLRFRFVCRSWRFSVPKTPLHLPTQLPWLMLSRRAFFDFSLNKTHLLLNLPEPSHRIRICGSSHGWLLILDQTPEVRLLNPITRVTLSLPPLHTFPNVVSFNYSKIGREYLIRNPYGGLYAFDLRQMCNSFLRKVVLSASPSQSDDFSAFAIVGQNNLAFCRKGYDSWVSVNEEEEGEMCCWEDIVYYNGLFFAVSKGGSVAVCDVEGSFPPRFSIIKTASPMQFSGDIYYTVFSGEDMLLLTRVLEQEFSDAVDESNFVYRTVGFDVFRLNWGLLNWEKIESLGDTALFVGGNASLSFKASEFVGCCADCIYFTDDYSESNHADGYGKHDLGIFRLRDQSIEPLPCFSPNSCSRLGWPLPVWVSPNPC